MKFIRRKKKEDTQGKYECGSICSIQLIRFRLYPMDNNDVTLYNTSIKTQNQNQSNDLQFFFAKE